MKYANPSIALPQFRQWLQYAPETGHFTWSAKKAKSTVIGARAGTITKKGYVVINFGGTLYFAHKLAWLYSLGEWPGQQIDHINGDKSDNRIANLRLVNNSVNAQNKARATAANATGFLGVWRRNDNGRYAASLKVGGKRFALGCFDSPREAHAAYLAAKAQLHPGFVPARFVDQVHGKNFCPLEPRNATQLI